MTLIHSHPEWPRVRFPDGDLEHLLRSLLALSICGWLLSSMAAAADPPDSLPTSPSQQVSQKVHDFETRLYRQLPDYEQADSVLTSDAYRAGIRCFFSRLPDREWKLAAIDMLDRRYVYVVDPELRAELLGPLLEDADPAVRSRAAEAVAYNNCGSRYAEQLTAMLTAEADPKTLNNVIAAMGRSQDPEFVPYVTSLIQHPDGDVRATALRHLTILHPDSAFAHNQQQLDDANPQVRSAAVQNLSNFQDPRTVSLAEQTTQDSDAKVRERAVWVLGQLKSQQSVAVIAARLSDDSHHVRSQAIQVLGQLRPPGYRNVVAKMLNDPDEVVRRYATSALKQWPESADDCAGDPTQPPR